MLKISIPKPCHEDWNAMTPNEQGRHCNICSKTVVDFTGMNDDAVQHYFLNRKEGSTCGRFKPIQLSPIVITVPDTILQMQLPAWKQFLAACLLAFSSLLFSCDAVVTTGEVAATTPFASAVDADSTIINKALTADSLQTDVLQSTCTTTTGFTVILPAVTMGDVGISIAEDTTITRLDLKQPDTTATTDSISFTGMVNSKFLRPDSTQIKNPPAVDSIKCDANATNYS